MLPFCITCTDATVLRLVGHKAQLTHVRRTLAHYELMHLHPRREVLAGLQRMLAAINLKEQSAMLQLLSIADSSRGSNLTGLLTHATHHPSSDVVRLAKTLVAAHQRRVTQPGHPLLIRKQQLQELQSRIGAEASDSLTSALDDSHLYSTVTVGDNNAEVLGEFPEHEAPIDVVYFMEEEMDERELESQGAILPHVDLCEAYAWPAQEFTRRYSLSRVQEILITSALVHGASRALTSYLHTAIYDAMVAMREEVLRDCTCDVTSEITKADSNLSRVIAKMTATIRIRTLNVCPVVTCKSLNLGNSCSVCGSDLLQGDQALEAATYSCVLDCLMSLLEAPEVREAIASRHIATPGRYSRSYPTLLFSFPCFVSFC
jgi:hypothetical protein